MSSSEKEVRDKIISKFLENPAIKFLQLANNVGTSLSTVKRTISKYKKGLSVDRKKGSGRKKGPADKKLARTIKNLYARNPNTSVRDMAAKAGTSKSTVQRVKKFYNLRTYKVQKIPDRSEEKEKVAKRRARRLYEGYLTKFDCIVMDDETYCKSDFNQLPGHKFYTARTKGGVRKDQRTTKISKFPKQFMVWQAICGCGLRSEELVFQGTINSQIYIKKCLEEGLKPFIRQHGGSVIFWPDLATCH